MMASKTRPLASLLRRRQPPQRFSVSDSQFGIALENIAGHSLLPGNRIEMLTNGVAAYPAMLAAIAAAQHSVNFENYIFWDGEAAESFIAAFLERAAAGVRVRIILDAFGSLELSSATAERLRAGGCQLEFFHPFRIPLLAKYLRRTHRRLLICDGTAGFVGGMGIADIWLGNADAEGRWRDNMWAIRGPLVRQLQRTFAQQWWLARDELLSDPRDFPDLDPTGRVAAIAVNSAPHVGGATMKRVIRLLIRGAAESLDIANSYFVPTRAILQDLRAAARRGVRVRLLVPGERTDIHAVRWASRYYYEALLSGGVEIYEYNASMMHAKTIAVDGVWASVGSTNFDPRSLAFNYENNVCLRSAPLVEELTSAFEDDIARSQRMDLARWRRRPWSMRLREQAFRWTARFL